MGIRTKLFDKGRLIEEQMVRFLIKLDKRVSDLEGGEGTLGDRVEAVEDAIGDEETADTILYRLKALEDKQEPSNP